MNNSLKTMLVCPGQGAQYVGMGRDIYDTYAGARMAYRKTDDALEYKLSEIIFYGSKDELKKSFNTQPALMVTSVATWKALQEKYGSKLDKLNIKAVAGHSLGEYSALCIADAIEIDDCAKILHLRGKAMTTCVKNDTAMAAVLGSDKETIEHALNSQLIKCLVIANNNCPGQIVVSGYKDDIYTFQERMEGKCKKIMLLPVSGAFHSPLMYGAKKMMQKPLQELKLTSPKWPVLQNASSIMETNPEAIRENLLNQITAQVNWTNDINTAVLSHGINLFIELGGDTLTKLIKRINPDVKTVSLKTVEDIKSFGDKMDSGFVE